MFYINEDLSIYATRGDIVFFTVSAENEGIVHTFSAGDVLRIKIYAKKNCENVVLQKDFVVEADTQSVEVFLTGEDTKIGDVISKNADYWYEIELNPLTNPQTIIGNDEDGAKIFKLFPEGADVHEVIEEEDIPVVDSELDFSSERPVQNSAIARAFEQVENTMRGNTINTSAMIAEVSRVAEDAVSNSNEAIRIADEARGVNLKGYVKDTDLATPGSEAGLIKLFGDASYGLTIKNGYLVPVGASEKAISAKGSNNLPITPANLDYAVIRALAYNTVENGMSAEEKASAQAFLGLGSGAKIATGTYDGSGGYGDESKGNVLTFDFIPEILVVIKQETFGYGEYAIMYNSMTAGYRTTSNANTNSRTNTSFYVRWDNTNKKVTWYDSTADDQMNSTVTEYKWIAIGG